MSAPRGFGDQVEAADEQCVVDPSAFPRTGIPDWITLSGISDLAFRLYSIIKAHQSKDEPKPFPGQKSLARMLGYAKTDPIRDAIKELRDIGAITTELRPCSNGRKTHYTIHEMPAVNPGAYAGPRKTSDLYKPGVLEAMGDARARRSRGVSRNPSGRKKPAGAGDTLTKVHAS